MHCPKGKQEETRHSHNHNAAVLPCNTDPEPQRQRDEDDAVAITVQKAVLVAQELVEPRREHIIGRCCQARLSRKKLLRRVLSDTIVGTAKRILL